MLTDIIGWSSLAEWNARKRQLIARDCSDDNRGEHDSDSCRQKSSWAGSNGDGAGEWRITYLLAGNTWQEQYN
jgi:hypothetical protein